MSAAIYAGSCAAPQPPALALNALTPAAATDPDAPLVSMTMVPAGLRDLVASPHALVVTLGGDLDAVLACGNLSGAPGGSLNVTLGEQNASGYAGVALLTAAGTTTQVSLLLAELPLPSAAATATQPTGAATPQPPSVSIPPIAPVTVTPAAIATPAAAAVTSPYVSQQFGYRIAFDPPWTVIYGPVVDDVSDYIMLGNGTSAVDFLGVRGNLTAPQCMDRLYDFYRGREGFRSIVSRPNNAPDALMSSPTQAIEAWDVTYVDAQNGPTELTVYAVCRVLVPGEAYLMTTHESPRDQYAAQAVLRDQLYRGLTLP
jgi:hypothetical protein